MAYTQPPNGFRTFTIVWLTQSLSVVGSAMTGFALNIYLVQGLYPAPGQKAELALALTALNLAFAIPIVFGAPLAGAWADRHDRKRTMIVADALNGLTCLLIVVLMIEGTLRLWMLICTGVVSALAGAFHYAAFDSSYAMLVPDRLLPRANGMMQTTWAISGIVSPALAATVIALPALARQGVVPGAPLAAIRWRRSRHRRQCGHFFHVGGGAAARSRAVAEAKRCERQRQARDQHPGRYSRGGALYLAPPSAVVAAWHVHARELRRWHWRRHYAAAGQIQSRGGLEGARLHLRSRVGAGRDDERPGRRGRRLIHEHVGRTQAQARLWCPGSDVVRRRGQRRVRFVAAFVRCRGAAFIFSVMSPLLNAHSQTIWQTQTPREPQGRVFSVRRLIAQCSFPLGALSAGWLAGAFDPGHVLAVLGLLLALFCLAQLFNPYLLRVEDKAWLDRLAASRQA
jgi:MFS family permease